MSPTPFKAGFVVILGKPNAGKSTLLNGLLKFKLSIVSPKPQTTRHNIIGILNGEHHQICFLDTPGYIDKPKDGLQNALASSSRGAARQDDDLMILLVEPEKPSEELLRQLVNLTRSRSPLILAINKIDAASPQAVEAAQAVYSEALKPAAVVRISALKGSGIEELLKEIVDRLPESPAFYDTDQVTDRFERFFAAEIIREHIFNHYDEEIPHACAVVIDDFKEIPKGEDEIFATVFVERESQKGILIGQRGKKIRELSDKSRQAIQEFLGRPVFLELRVSVRQNWRKDPRSLKEFGYVR